MLPLTTFLLMLAGPAGRPEPGEIAPDFKLPSSAGGSVSLSELRGKKTVVLAFFPKAFTGG